MRRVYAGAIAVLVCGIFVGCSTIPVRDNVYDGPIPVEAFQVGLTAVHYPLEISPQDSFFVRVALGVEDAEIDSASLVGPRGTYLPLSGRGASWRGRIPAKLLSDPALLHTEDYGLSVLAWDSRANTYALGPVRVHHVFRTIPVAMAPSAGSREPLRPKFSWQPLPDDPEVGFHYVVIYSHLVPTLGHLDDTDEDVQSVQIPSDSTSYQVGVELSEGVYTWTLCAVDANGDSVCAPAVQFEVEASF
jgi:hypothetical protein